MEGSDWGGKEGRGREMEAENFTEMASDNSGISHSVSKRKVLENKLVYSHIQSPLFYSTGDRLGLYEGLKTLVSNTEKKTDLEP